MEFKIIPYRVLLFLRAGTTPILEKTLREWMGQMKIFHVGSHQFRNRSGSCSENCGFRIAQVVGCHPENGISYSENGISNSESCSEKTPERSQSSENGLFTGVLLGPGPESAPRSAFWAILGTCLGVPQRVLFECFLAFFGPKKRQKALKKHSLGHSEAGAQNCPKSTPGGTFRPGP